MSNAGKKRSGLGNFWDTVAPEQEQVDQAPIAPPRPNPVEARPSADTSPPRGRGRPRSEEPKARTTVNMSPQSWRLLEALRYRARMEGQRNATYAHLLDEAIALLAEQRGVIAEE